MRASEKWPTRKIFHSSLIVIFAHADVVVWLCEYSQYRCLSVSVRSCACVCPQHNSKTNHPKVSKLGMLASAVDIIEVLCLKGRRSRSRGHKVKKTHWRWSNGRRWVSTLSRVPISSSLFKLLTSMVHRLLLSPCTLTLLSLSSGSINE